MKLSTRARYAVMAMVDLAFLEAEKKVVSLQDIAERQELPVAYLEQIFGKLRKGNLVLSCRGAQGGYTLARASHTIRVSDVIYAVEPKIKTTRCENLTERGCHSSGNQCLTHDLWESLGQTIHGFLSTVTLQDIVSGTTNKMDISSNNQKMAKYHVL